MRNDQTFDDFGGAVDERHEERVRRIGELLPAVLAKYAPAVPSPVVVDFSLPLAQLVVCA